MTYVKTAPVPATRVDDIEHGSATPGPPGALEFYVSSADKETPAGMFYVCPCGCRHVGALAFRPAPSPSWEWDRNRDKPTLMPSVHHVGHWHGWLRAGVWESC